MLFGDLPIPERFNAAARAGFANVESWWPWPDANPSDAEIDRFVTALRDSGVSLRALNFWAGDMAAGDRGVMDDVEQLSDFRENIAIVIGIARRTGCRTFNALYGKGRSGASETQRREVAVANYREAARAAASVGGTVVIEPLKYPDNGHYPVLTLDDADDLRSEIGEPNVELLVDTFHLSANGVDVPAAIAAHANHVGHVQIADFPGRGRPGTGDIDFVAIGTALRGIAYEGYVGAEFVAEGSIPTPGELAAALETAR
ncbi:hydroxypyruvate isomerase [Microbacterium faecale]|uniref:Hydroxypyruvate isomerase n=2 Tax=Microbacterium faecale TaxID=1804630 RepID=A0A916Y2A8_9MICO|nr:hydroxypyruvate isomerase [Microbacterium faecale]